MDFLDQYKKVPDTKYTRILKHNCKYILIIKQIGTKFKE